MADNENSPGTGHPEYLVDAPPGDLPEGHIEKTSFFYQLRFMWGAFMHSSTRDILIVTFLGILVLICLIAYGQLAINSWTKDFWNAISRRDLGDFGMQLGIFFMIASGLLILNITQTFLNQFFKMKLREGLTDDLISEWLKPKRAYRLTLAGELGVNPDQRLHEDARHLAEATADLGINLLQAAVILCTFITVLWQTSAGFVFNFHGYSFPLPGYMVWAVFIYAGSASFLTWLVGHNLVGINADRYAKEAELRTTLMRTNQRIDAITLMRGEGDEQKRLDVKVEGVLAAIWRIVVATTRLTGITAAYGWISNVAPAVIAAPIYFGGGIDLGGLMQAVNSFNQAHNSLRWFVDNYGALADWRATMLRVSSFRQALERMDELDTPQKGRIQITTNRKDRLSFENLVLRTANGHVRLAEPVLEVLPGENLMLYSGPDVDKAIVFQAITGLWPWGRGRIGLPANDHIAYIPARSYLPQGTLRAALLYPLGMNHPDDAAVADVLKTAGLASFIDALDREADWDKILNEGQKQSLSLVRTILQKPSWIIINQAFDGLETTIRKQIKTMMKTYLQDVTLINVTDKEEYKDIFTRRVDVLFDPETHKAAVKS